MSTEELVQVSKATLDRYMALEAKAKLSARRATAKNVLYVEKAKKAGITVTKAEIDAKIKKDDTNKNTETTDPNEVN